MGYKIIRGFFQVVIFIVIASNVAIAQIFSAGPACVETTAGTGTASTGAATATCTDKVYFFDDNPNSISRIWLIGGATLYERAVNSEFKNIGASVVNLIIKAKDGTTQTFTKTINVGTYPTQPMFNKKTTTDSTVCDGSKVTLDPFKGQSAAGNYEYLWFPKGEKTKTITVDSSGCYSVEVKDPTSGCSRRASVNVKFCMQQALTKGGSEKWYFGQKATIDFQSKSDTVKLDSTKNTGEVIPKDSLNNTSYSPKVSVRSNSIDTDGASAMVFGPEGDLALYSDGNKIYSGIDDSEIKMVDGSAFTANAKNTANGVIIVPKITCIECPHHQYYVFTVNRFSHKLTYSVVDMRYNEKKGAITEVNIPAAFEASEKLAALPFANGKGFYIYSHNNTSNEFNVIGIDSTGLSVKSYFVGENNDAASTNNYFAISQDNTQMAQGIVKNNKNYVEIYRIDNTSGAISNAKLIDLGIAAPPNIYGISFSPNGKLLYATISGNSAIGEKSYLIQIEIATGVKNIIASSTTESYGAVSYGPVSGSGSKYVYLSIKGRTTAPYLQSPNNKGNAMAVGYTDVVGSANIGIGLNGTAKLGLPNLVFATKKQDGEGLSAEYQNNCFGASTILTTQGVCSPMKNKVTWVFDDGTSKEGTTVVYKFPKVGWNIFKIKVKVLNPPPVNTSSSIINNATETECIEHIFDAKIYIKPAPVYQVPHELAVCTNGGEVRKVAVSATGGRPFTYEWSTTLGTIFSTDSVYNFYSPNLNYIEVKNIYGCVNKDSINVIQSCEPRFYVPNVFTPNNDGVNDVFEITHEYASDVLIKIYNRWGELVYQTDEKYFKWDGKYKGKIYTNEVYPYVISYRMQYDVRKETRILKGAVWILP